MTSSDGGRTAKERRQSSPDVNEHLIAECYSQLTNDDGSPDISLRQANLRNLVESISPWELLYLRSLIRKTAIKFADLPGLPEEIVATISASLDYQDVLNCTNVSKGWRRAWTADMVASDVARAHFAGLVESHPDISPWSLLQPLAAKAAARRQGKYISSLHIDTSGSSLLDCTALKLDDRALEHAKYKAAPAGPVAPYSYAYCDGKIAWQWDPYSFFIDDIRRMTRTLVSPPDLVVRGEKDFVVSALSNKLLVLANARTERSLIVYHLEKNQYRRVVLPSRMYRVKDGIHLHKETLIVAFRDDVKDHVWRWERGLIELKMPDMRKTPLYAALDHATLDGSRKMLLVCHPTKSSVFYLVHGFLVKTSQSYIRAYERAEPQRLVIVVQKFNDTKHVQTLSYETSLITRSELDHPVHCQPVNAYGLCSLGVYFEDPPYDILDSGAPCAKSAQTPPNMILSRINFNTINETFSCTTQELKGMRRPLWDNPSGLLPEREGGVVWNDVIYYIQNHTTMEATGTPWFWKTGVEMSGVRSLCIADKSSTQVINEDSPWFTEEEDTSYLLSDGCRGIAVDDDFLVAISKNGYVVWNHGDFGLREKPWVRNHGSAWRLRLTTQDTGCPVQGCLVPVCRH
ncbi:F-box domain-containing protein [Colletotrichum navitas]|uniref:F-box domain-containing protein n=1 Tax=Colletotrichum navitas TaxID=681940 RepID=A0AAD8V0P0_9PEZI|nr:F-box domain-containing protein [Colletotrichum navitas]KAK1573464.1 F-box domain-containing protein [Colletotrichum navitas]